MANEPINVTSSNSNVPAVHGSAGDPGTGVFGETTGGGHGVRGHTVGGHGVHGDSDTGRGVVGVSRTFFGVSGQSTDGVGVSGESITNIGVSGKCGGGNSGVTGVSDTGLGVFGQSRTNHGVHGESAEGRGVVGQGRAFGVTGQTTDGIGVSGQSSTNIGVFGKGGKLAGLFEGDVKVTGKLQCDHDVECNGKMRLQQDVECQGNILMAKTGDIKLSNADCAEDFDVSGAIAAEPGTVMVLGLEGALFESRQPYDKRVAGVISGAGNYKPAIVLDKQDTEANRQPIALMGKTYCKVDAQFGPVEIGDLLTTSSTPGHAMKASDPLMAFGAVIGKALRPLPNGRGLVPILIALQ